MVKSSGNSTMSSWILKIALIGYIFASGVTSADYGYDVPSAIYSGDYNYGNDSYNPVDPYVGPIPKTLHDRLGTYNFSLIALFGSKALMETLVFEPSSSPLDYWKLDQVHHEITTRLVAEDQRISTSDKDNLNEVLTSIDTEMERLVNRSDNPEMHKHFNNNRASLDCAIGRKTVNQYFSHIMLSVRYSYDCSGEIPDLWHALLIGKYDKTCLLKESLRSMIIIDQIAKTHNTSQEILDIKFDLLFLLSNNYDYLRHLLCENHNTADKCPLINEIICNSLTSNLILALTTGVQNGSKAHPPQNPTDMFTLLEVQTHLAKISSKFANTVIMRANPTGAVNFAKDMLDNYVGIVDTAIGSSSVDAWKQTSRSSSDDRFKTVLVDSETYVGQFSKLILSNTKGAPTSEVDKTTMSVKMGRYSNNKDGNQTVEFSFSGTQIWTEPFLGDNSSDVYVYALHYNSWRETMKEIRNDSSDPTLKSKFFVGEGGVVSLSTATDKEKKSVPVTYKMKFANDVISAPGSESNSVRRCLSCEYLDADTKQWQSTGCYVTGADDEGVTCHCNHTTNFAAFMMPYTPKYNTTKEQDAWLNILEYAGSVVSVVSLLISFIAFCLVRESVRNDRLKAHMNLVIALLFVHLIQLGADFAVQSNQLCVATTIATHYFLLSTFMWMFVEGIFLYLYVVQVFVHSKLVSRWWMYAIGWFLPIIIVGISAGYGLPNDIYIQPLEYCAPGEYLYPPISYDDLRKYAICWLNPKSGMTWSFIGPAIAVIVFNIVILCKVIQVLVKLSERSKGMKPFTAQHQMSSQGHGYHNSAFRPKGKPTSKGPEYRTTASEQFASSIVETDDSTLHGSSSVSNNKPKPRSPSQVYLQNRVTERPRAASSSNGSDRNFLADVRTAVKGAIVLLPLLGIPWIVGMFGYQSYALTVIFVIFNSIQGLAIFLVYCVFNHEVRRGLQRHMQLYRINRDTTRRGRTSSTSSLKSAFNRGLLRSWRRRSTAVSTLSNHV